MKKMILVALGSTLSFLSLPISVFAQMYDRNIDYSYTNPAADSATILFIVLYIVLMCIIVGVKVAICVWVYKDAKKHNLENPALWVLLVLFMSIPGLILYLLVGRKSNLNSKVAETKAPVNTTA